MGMLNFGDEVVIFVFYWVFYFDMVFLVGGIFVIVEVKLENGFKFILDQFEVVIIFKIKWFLFNLFLNLIGVGYNYDEFKVLIDVLMCYLYVWVLMDDMYEYFVFGDFKFCMLVQVELVFYDCILIVNGVFKVYVMMGWCIGYVVGFEQIIKVMCKV